MTGPEPGGLPAGGDSPSPESAAPGGGWIVLAVLVALVGGMTVLAFVNPGLAGTIGVLISLIVMILLHEFGHFMMAKRAGMKVTEFFVGFGPRLWSFRRGETEYGVKAIPAGGYVKIIGMSNLEEVDPADEERTYRAKPFRDRLGVAVAGSTMHFLIAGVLLFSVYALVGVPSGRVTPVVENVAAKSPAESAGFAAGDRIIAVDGTPMRYGTDVTAYIESHGTGTLDVVVLRRGLRYHLSVTPELTKADSGPEVPRVGVYLKSGTEKLPVGRAVRDTVVDTPRYGWATIKALGQIFSPHGIRNYTHLVSGKGGDENERLLSPVGAARVASQAVANGWSSVLMFLFAINVFVGVFNMVPLLPLDGGHVAIATYEKVVGMAKKRRVQVDVGKLMPITAVVLALLVFVGLSALYLDIVRPVSSP